ncbi:peptidase [Sphaerisporangium krabiense]|uniref:Pimeloyl-ACP methyl ester carboxylesterase n=1 Tax=Sphaerisporangium krabiense TaxID=763782 RepID=A0A7W8Z717_9ACTN|nr:alpha/beta hydrolase [Sphaerisporangium krabiense]MBB5628586.1 pimeloyl-ACP methyl ester carboxylesterase [Sphaerisporangium krabiense]GII60578.1 peptidase [Sphaerisporangium krabiense]
MRRVLGVVASAAVPIALVAGLTTGARDAAAAPRDTVQWGACPGPKTAAKVECGTVRVPLDHAKPDGPAISLALNRVRGSASHDQNGEGVLLVNPGGPGASGITLARYVAAALPRDVAARYDVIGFDPRGVGASEPALSCVDPRKHFAAPRLDQVPGDRAAEAALLAKAQEYAQACATRWPLVLPHMATENSARDMDAIRQALGEQKISYLGYSYGTYLGAVYATLFPSRVRRLVLDSVVDPEGVWYDANIAQDYAFDRRHHDFLAWVARHHDVYRLGRTESDVAAAYAGMRRGLAARPSGPIGPSELDDIFTVGGYTDLVWPQLAGAFAAYVRKGQGDLLVSAYRQHVDHDAAAENNYAVYLAVQCRDADWPRDWGRWVADTVKVNAKAPFMAWQNAWYNAPCAFWPVKGGPPLRVGGSAGLPPILLVQSRYDAATPYAGALRVRARFPSARLLREGGGNHGVSFGGNPCVDRHLAAYLRDGSLPGGADRHAGRRPDATCAAGPEPKPLPPPTRGHGHLRLRKVIAAP